MILTLQTPWTSEEIAAGIHRQPQHQHSMYKNETFDVPLAFAREWQEAKDHLHRLEAQVEAQRHKLCSLRLKAITFGIPRRDPL